MLFYLGALQVKNEIQFSQIFFLRTELDELELVKFACCGSVYVRLKTIYDTAQATSKNETILKSVY